MQLSFRLHPSTFVYTKQCPVGITPFAQFKEEKGISYLVKEEDVFGIETHFPCRCLQIIEETSLEAVGITAKVAAVLAANNIPCNVIAAYFHDYFFVPIADGEKAFEIVQAAFKKA